MRVLTIDTATTAASVGLVVADEVHAAAPIRDRSAAQHVLSAVARVLAEAGLRSEDIDRIAVGTGPGSFTGLRIGLATAQGLAAGGDIELVGVATTDALRWAARDADADAVAVIDARRDEVFVAGAHGQPAACAPHELVERLAVGSLLVGDGAVRYRAQLGGFAIPADDSPLHVPAPRALAALSASGAPADPAYVRLPDARTTEQRA